MNAVLRGVRGTVRVRLALLYVAVSVVSGAALLVVTYLLVANRFPTVYRTDPRGAEPMVRACTMPGFARDYRGCVESARSLVDAQRVETLRELVIQSGTALAIMTAVSVGLGWWVAGRVLRPLRTITATARRISANDLHERLAMTGRNDELKELGDTFDGLLARLESAFTAQRQFVANASHEMRTPLARQRTLLEVALASSQPTVPSLQAACRRALAAGQEQEELIEALLTLARSERGLDRCEPLDLRAIADDVVAARTRDAEARGVRMQVALGAAVVHGDARLTERLVANLLDNAVRHNLPGRSPGGRVRIETATSNGMATLRVENTGPTVPPEDLDRLFRPFSQSSGERTATHHGLGLGLAIVAAIATAHGATINARAQPSGGLDIEIRFPGNEPPTGTE